MLSPLNHAVLVVIWKFHKAWVNDIRIVKVHKRIMHLEFYAQNQVFNTKLPYNTMSYCFVVIALNYFFPKEPYDTTKMSKEDVCLLSRLCHQDKKLRSSLSDCVQKLKMDPIYLLLVASKLEMKDVISEYEEENSHEVLHPLLWLWTD